MLGLCDTMVVTEYFTTSFLRAIFRGRMELPDLAVVSMALDAARGLQVTTCYVMLCYVICCS